MKRTRPRIGGTRLAVLLVAVLALTCGAIAAGVAPSVAWAQNGSTHVPTSSRDSVTFFHDATIGPNEVYQDVVAIGGTVTVKGTVLRSVVVVGGDVNVTSGARVGIGMTHEDAAVVCVWGHITTEPGAVVAGEQTSVISGLAHGARSLGRSLAASSVRPWSFGGADDWFGWTIGLAVVALLAAAIAPRQLTAVSNRVRRQFWPSLGWGALGAIVVIPLVTVGLIVTIIGILAVVPWLAVAVPVMMLFGFAAVSVWLGDAILARIGSANLSTRGRLMAAAALGVVVLSLIRLVPIAGWVAGGILWLVGLGAVMASLVEWRRNRRAAKANPSAARTDGPPSPTFSNPSSASAG